MMWWFFFFFSGAPPLSYSVEKRRDPKNLAQLPKDNALSWLLDYERILSKKLKLPLPKIDFFDYVTLKETWIAMVYHIYLNLGSY